MGHRENSNRRLLSFGYRTDSNKVKLSAAITFEHDIIKSAISILLVKLGHEITTEAIFETGGRADVFDLTRGVVYEVLHSESEEYFESKKIRYPPEICEIVAVRTNTFQGLNLEQIKEKIKTIIY